MLPFIKAPDPGKSFCLSIAILYRYPETVVIRVSLLFALTGEIAKSGTPSPSLPVSTVAATD